jgi:hypothetical protein
MTDYVKKSMSSIRTRFRDLLARACFVITPAMLIVRKLANNYHILRRQCLWRSMIR